MFGPANTLPHHLFATLGRNISTSGDEREGAFIFQGVSVLNTVSKKKMMMMRMKKKMYADHEVRREGANPF